VIGLIMALIFFMVIYGGVYLAVEIVQMFREASHG
jgi:hypothetical protein